MSFICQLHQTHLELVVNRDEEILLIFVRYQLVNLLYLNDFCCISANFAIRVDDRVRREVFNLGKLILFLVIIMSLED